MKKEMKTTRNIIKQTYNRSRVSVITVTLEFSMKSKKAIEIASIIR